MSNSGEFSAIEGMAKALTKAQRSLGSTILLGVASVAGLYWYGAKQGEKAKEYENQADVYEQTAKDHMTRAQSLDLALSRQMKRTEEAENKLQEAMAKLASTPKPPKPGPKPEQAEELAADLIKAGLGGSLKVYAPPFGEPGLDSYSAGKVWDWHAEAVRVPALEARLANAETAIEAGAKALDESKLENRLCLAENAEWRDSVENYNKAMTEQSNAIKGLQKQVKVERLQKWIIGASAAIVGYFAGRK